MGPYLVVDGGYAGLAPRREVAEGQQGVPGAALVGVDVVMPCGDAERGWRHREGSTLLPSLPWLHTHKLGMCCVPSTPCTHPHPAVRAHHAHEHPTRTQPPKTLGLELVQEDILHGGAEDAHKPR